MRDMQQKTDSEKLRAMARWLDFVGRDNTTLESDVQVFLLRIAASLEERPKSRRVANTIAYVVFDEKGKECSAGFSAKEAWDSVAFVGQPWAYDLCEPGDSVTTRHRRLVDEAQKRGWRCIGHDLVAQEDGPPWGKDEQ